MANLKHYTPLLRCFHDSPECNTLSVHPLFVLWNFFMQMENRNALQSNFMVNLYKIMVSVFTHYKTKHKYESNHSTASSEDIKSKKNVKIICLLPDWLLTGIFQKRTLLFPWYSMFTLLNEDHDNVSLYELCKCYHIQPVNATAGSKLVNEVSCYSCITYIVLQDQQPLILVGIPNTWNIREYLNTLVPYITFYIMWLA